MKRHKKPKKPTEAQAELLRRLNERFDLSERLDPAQVAFHSQSAVLPCKITFTVRGRRPQVYWICHRKGELALTDEKLVSRKPRKAKENEGDETSPFEPLKVEKKHGNAPPFSSRWGF